jgi:hypothetical protein
MPTRTAQHSTDQVIREYLEGTTTSLDHTTKFDLRKIWDKIFLPSSKYPKATLSIDQARKPVSPPCDSNFKLNTQAKPHHLEFTINTFTTVIAILLYQIHVHEELSDRSL